MAFAHTPYDGSKQPFTVGLESIPEADWLELDQWLDDHLLRKQELLRSARDAVFLAEEGTEQAQREIFDLIRVHLRTWSKERHLERTAGSPLGAEGFAKQDDDEDEPYLVRSAMLVQEDLVLMRAGKNGYRIAAACVCFPSSWSLQEKFGQAMSEIHATVPDFNTGRMGRITERIFTNLHPDQLLCRYNWSIYEDANLHHPQIRKLNPPGGLKDEALLARLFLRVERQTLRRLALAGDVLFTIKVHHDPFALLIEDPRRVELADGLRAQLLALEEDQLNYKGLVDGRNRLVNALEWVAKFDSKH